MATHTPNRVYLQNWATTAEGYGLDFKEVLYKWLSEDVECDPGCTANPLIAVKVGITQLLALVEDLTARVEALENP